ncbi:MAG: acyl-CoA dehydrogenase family protein [Candidatus Eiseniibacteriota bacterium]
MAKARALAPLFRAQAAANEEAGKLTDETLQALRSGDYFGLLVPECFGGAEANPVEALEIYETICAADASTGWVLMACNVGTGSAAGYLPPEGAQEVFGKRIPIIAGQGAPRGRAVKDGKGYRLSGRWAYGSGLLHADWLHTGGTVFEGDRPRLKPVTNRPEARTFIVPIEHVEFLGNWDVVGLRATGSVDYALNDVYVPAEFTHSPDALVPQQGGNLYRIGLVGMAPLGHAGAALGIGRRVLDELRALANAPGGRPSALADSASDAGLHEHFAVAEAKLRAARAFCYETWHDVATTIGRGDPVALRQFTMMRLSLNHATTAVAEICTFAHKTAGGVSLRSGVLQRCFRDMFAATQHRIVSDFMTQECGRELLGFADDKLWSSRGLVDAPAL